MHVVLIQSQLHPVLLYFLCFSRGFQQPSIKEVSLDHIGAMSGIFLNEGVVEALGSALIDLKRIEGAGGFNNRARMLVISVSCTYARELTIK